MRIVDESFSRAFKQSTGIPPHQWLLDRRVETAKDLLRRSCLSLTDIALTCGFSDQSHFTRVFVRACGVSPGVWRRGKSRFQP
jgi:AraC family transcriptional regulator